MLLPVLDGHVIETAQLPLVHHDPFDRLLIAQARLEGLMAVSSDRHWPSYDVTLFIGTQAKFPHSSCVFSRTALENGCGAWEFAFYFFPLSSCKDAITPELPLELEVLVELPIVLQCGH